MQSAAKPDPSPVRLCLLPAAEPFFDTLQPFLEAAGFEVSRTDLPPVSGCCLTVASQWPALSALLGPTPPAVQLFSWQKDSAAALTALCRAVPAGGWIVLLGADISLESYFDLSLDLLAIADLQGRYLRLNAAWETTLGFTRQELMAGTYLDFIHPDDIEPTRQAMSRLEGQQDVSHFVNRYRHRNGGYVSLDWRSRPIGGLVYGVARDISSSLDMQRRLDRERDTMLQLYRASQVPGTAAELALAGAALLREWGGCAHACIDLAGFGVAASPAEAQLRSGPALLVRIDTAPALSLVSNHASVEWPGELPGYESVVVLVLRSTEQRLGFALLADPRPGLFAPELLALLERRAAGLAISLGQRMGREALEESEFWLRESQAITAVGSYRFNVATGQWSSSPQLDRIFGIDGAFARDVEGWGRIIHAEDREPMTRYLVEEVLGAGRTFDREYRIVRHSDGAERWVHGRGSLRRDASGQVLEMFGTIQDITARRQVEAQRADLERQLQQAQKLESIGRLAGGIAHDFNNLLTVINGYSNLLLERLPETDPSRRPLGEICRAGERAASLTRQLLAFSRKQILEPKLVDLNALIRQNRDMLARLLGEDIEMRVLLEPGLGATLTDANQLHQVLMNLITNSRDAMASGGTLTLRTSTAHLDEEAAGPLEIPSGNYACIQISDTGSGMDEATRHRVFEPFFTTKEEGKGTGLGLSTVYGIVRQCGGGVQVDSAPGQGATFRVYLPFSGEAPEALDPRSEGEPEGGNETILLVEDQDDVRALAREVLQSFGYRVLEAGSGSEALEILRQHTGALDLLLSDVVMPRMTGPQLVERVRALRPHLRVLFMSGHTSDSSLVRGGFLGAGVEVVQKPFTPETLARRVRRALTGRPLAPPLLLLQPGGALEADLAAAGYQVTAATTARQARERLRDSTYAIVLLVPALAGANIGALIRHILTGTQETRLILLCKDVQEASRLSERYPAVCAALYEPVPASTVLMVLRQSLGSRGLTNQTQTGRP